MWTAPAGQSVNGVANYINTYSNVLGSGHQADPFYLPLQHKTHQQCETVWMEPPSLPKASHEYRGTFEVQQDRMDMNVLGSGHQADPFYLPLQHKTRQQRETVLMEPTSLLKASHEYRGTFEVQQDRMDMPLRTKMPPKAAAMSTPQVESAQKQSQEPMVRKGSLLSRTEQCLNAVMDQRMDDVISLCCEIADQPEFENTWKNIRKGMLITAAGAGAGGLLFGPPGLALGGAAGGLVAWWKTSGQFKSVPKILMELPQAEKQKLYNDIVANFDNLTWTDAAQLVSTVVGNAKLKQRVTDVLLNYLPK